MSDITCDRLDLVKTSGTGLPCGWQAVAGRGEDTALGFVGSRGARHAVEDAAPLGFARVKFIVREIAGFRPRPRLGGERPKHPRPPAVRIVVAVGMQAGEE